MNEILRCVQDNNTSHDKAQRVQALDPSQSFIVQAPAGSGKTALLIQRFLTLLNTVQMPEEILAITFTKKAASEMRIRIIKALKEATMGVKPNNPYDQLTRHLAELVLARDKIMNWQLIDNPNQLRIQTIDSFCTYLTKQLPLLSHFGAQPHISEQPMRLYSEAAQEILSYVETNVDWSQSIAILLLHLDNDLTKLHNLLVSLLAKRDQWLPYIQLKTEPEQIRNQLEKHLSAVISDSLTSLRHLFDKNIAEICLPLVRFAATNIRDTANPHVELSLCQDLTELPKTCVDNKAHWLGIAHFLLTKSGEWRKRLDVKLGFPPLKQLKNKAEQALHQQYREQYAELIKKLADNDTLRQALADLFDLPDPHYTDQQWEILQALLQVLKMAAAQLRICFMQQGQIDFIENTRAALLALGEEDCPTDLALALDYQIKHILIDECQDTSTTQYQLLEKLTQGWMPNDGRTLFVVGDPMQSIYRFREAEVGLFIRMQHSGLGHIKLTPLTLSVNFRSTENIIHWNNTHFTHIFPQKSDIATGAVHYSPSMAHTKTPSHVSSAHESICVISTADAHTQLSDLISYIKNTLSAYPEDTIAILVRSRSHLATLIPALKKADIPYKAINIDPLGARQSIQDLLSLTCAYLHPYDRIAWLAVLRAPWCGLSLEDLFKLTSEERYKSLLEQLADTTLIQQLSPFGQSRIQFIYPLLEAAISERDRYPLRTTIENLWQALGGPACLNDKSELQDAQAYFELLELLQQQIVLSPEKLKEKVNSLYANTEMTQAKVQIMTIHTAKGLEFDTVILPHLERKLPNDEKTLLAWMEQPLVHHQSALLLAPIHATVTNQDSLYEFITRKQRNKLHYESDRLFYVATTRAKKRLCLSFTITADENNRVSLPAGSFLEKIGPFIQKQIANINKTELIILHQPCPSTRQIKRLAASWRHPSQITATPVVNYHLNKDGFQLPQHRAKKIGIIGHRLLQILSQQGSAWWLNQHREMQKKYLHYQLQQAGVLVDTEKAVWMLIALVEKTLADERGQWILFPHLEAKSEWTLTVANPSVKNIVIDRTFISTDGMRWIIDYKTTAFDHQELDHFLEKEYKKYREKMQVYADALHLMDKRPIHLGLYFPALPAWYEWESTSNKKACPPTAIIAKA